MNKVFLFVIMLVSASFVGCIEGSNDETLIEDSAVDESSNGDTTVDESSNEDTTQEGEKITPVGVEEESTLPEIYFLGVTYPDLHLAVALYDSDGFIKSYSFKNNETFKDGGSYGYSFLDSYSDYMYCGVGGVHIMDNASFVAEYDCHPASDTIFLDICNHLNYVNQTITMMVEDDEGHTVSAEYDFKETDFERCPDYAYRNDPVISFYVTERSDGIYFAHIIQVKNQAPLEDFSFWLKDGSGSTYVGGNGFGKVAMQYEGASWNNSGYETGIDMTYSGDDAVLQNRAENVTNDDGAIYPVHFSDEDRNGKLSAGDLFLVYNTNSNGPAEDGWTLDIRYDPSYNTVGSALLL